MVASLSPWRLATSATLSLSASRRIRTICSSLYRAFFICLSLSERPLSQVTLDRKSRDRSGLLNNWDVDVLDAIEEQWAPQYARYCWNCGDLSTRFWSARHFEEGSCPHCDRQLSFEFRVPPTFTLEAYVDGTPSARPWFGDLSGLPHRAEKLAVEQVLPLRLQIVLLTRKGQDGWTSRTPVGALPENAEQRGSLCATIGRDGWSLEVQTVEGKIAVSG